jgi:hypothetical protein
MHDFAGQRRGRKKENGEKSRKKDKTVTKW